MIVTLTGEDIRIIRGMIQEEAERNNMTEDEITEKCQECMAEANKWSGKMIHDKSMQDLRDRMYERWVMENGELAAAWAMAQPGRQQVNT